MAHREDVSVRDRLRGLLAEDVRHGVVLLAAGVSLAVLGVGWVRGEFYGTGAALSPTLLFELFIHVGLPGIVATYGLWLTRSPFVTEERRLVAIWTFGGITVFLALVTWAYVDDLLAVGLQPHYLNDLQTYGSLGGVFGAVAGVNRATAAQNKRLADLAADQRESLAFLHHLLRHDIRNGMTIIDGYAGLLERHVEPEGESTLAAIGERSRRVFELLDEAGTVVESVTAEPRFEPVYLETTVARAVDAVTSANPAVTAETEIPAGLAVSADHLLAQAIENLVRNAVEHSDQRVPSVSVTAREVGKDVEIRVADDGPGIPRERRSEVFSLGKRGIESEGDGIGLYIVDRLTTRYHGTVEIEDNDPRGAVFVLTLPAA